MLLRTGEQIENDLFHIFETLDLDYEEIEKKDLNTKNPIFNICTKDSQICNATGRPIARYGTRKHTHG